jgi:hypothetical protein
LIGAVYYSFSFASTPVFALPHADWESFPFSEVVFFSHEGDYSHIRRSSKYCSVSTVSVICTTFFLRLVLEDLNFFGGTDIECNAASVAVLVLEAQAAVISSCKL